MAITTISDAGAAASAAATDRIPALKEPFTPGTKSYLTPAQIATYVAGGAGWATHLSKPLPFYFAVDYGVVADGVTDDTTALNAAFAAVAATGGILWLPADTMLCNGQLLLDGSNVTVRGMGRKISNIYSTYTAGKALVVGNGLTQRIEIALEDLSLFGVADQTFVQVRWVRGFYMRRCYEYTDCFMEVGDRSLSSSVTMTIASPCVVSWTSHGLVAGNAVIFTNSGGALPTGITSGTTYYVISTGLTANSFQVSATVGGSAVNTSGSQSGTQFANMNKAAYVVQLEDFPDSHHLVNDTPLRHHIQWLNFAGQWVQRHLFIEGDFSQTLDGIYAPNNVQFKVDDVQIVGGYCSRFRYAFNFTDARIVNLLIDGLLSEGNYINAVRSEITSATTDLAGAVGAEVWSISGKFSSLTGSSIYIRNDRVSTGQASLIFPWLDFTNYNTRTPVMIDNQAGGDINNLVFGPINVDFVPYDANQDIVRIIGGSSAPTIDTVLVSAVSGRAATTALRSAIRVEGQVSRIGINTAAIAVKNCTIALDDQTTTTPLGLTRATVAAADLLPILDQSAGVSKPIKSNELAAAFGWHVLAKSAVAVSHTGSTSITTLATVTVPANAMGPNGGLRITAIWKHTNNANNKTLVIQWGGTSGTTILAQNVTTTRTTRDLRMIHNVNATNVQKASADGRAEFGGWGSSANDVTSSARDTTADQDIVFRVTLADSADTASLEAYIVEVCYGA